ncbi:uncharacterized protein [Palaemon carinicauda]|uniref:uncharacterized protein n=1 Tax=Palaemon carinicauda TaxID=392227 RepID=UPI0035B6740E
MTLRSALNFCIEVWMKDENLLKTTVFASVVWAITILQKGVSIDGSARHVIKGILPLCTLRILGCLTATVQLCRKVVHSLKVQVKVVLMVKMVLKVFTQKDIPVNHDQIPRYEMLKDWPHLSSVFNKISVYQPELDIGILIGSNCPTALQPLEVVPTSGYGPFAVRYLHGGTVNGPVHVKVSSNGVSCHRLLVSDVQHVTDCITVESIRKYFELDFPERDLGSVPDERGLSFEDTRFVKRCQDDIEFRDGHFQLPIPLRDCNVNLPNNKKQAVSRAKWQRRKMKNSEDYRQQYTAFMDKLFEKGYDYKIPDDEVNKIPFWYLPHHTVFPPKKGKIRVVFYFSAKFEGVSLNDVLLQGPNLTNSLTGVLIRFRQEVYAFIGDIEAMFFQIKIPPENQEYVRLLWWPNGDTNRPLAEFRMAVHIFGAISSPSIANTALKATADKADEKYDSTVGNTIRHNFYVDDCLMSCADVPTVVKLVKDLVSATGEGGFRLTKFVSNSSDVLKALPAKDCSVEGDKFNLDVESLMTKALGMLWDLKEDSFKFSIELKDNPFTRRGLLSTISSFYDPLGLLSPIILPAKKLLQELCQVESLDWHERIPDELAERWQHWIQGLHLLEQLSILKVGGRIRRSDIPRYAKHPILLPKKHHVTTLLIRHEHELLAHSGRNHVLSNLRQKYWIINANATVRNVLFHCVTCRKLKEPALSQKMANLTADRLEPSPPFSNVGIDLFGPYYIKEGRKEGVKESHPKVIRCDNGTNFHGAERELKAALDEMEEKKIEKYLSHLHIEWKFNPPAASHMGGCWERKIRTVRKVLSALVKEFGERLNDESLRTLLCEVESIVNSRPLTTVSDSVDDLEPLIPNHLLIPKSYVIPPPGLFQKDDVYMRRRWRCVQYLTNLFWSRFRKEFLSTLQTRQKWNEPRRNLIVGDVVLVSSDIEPRNHWPMGRVLEVYPGDKGTIRSAKIKTLSSVIVRPIQKLVLLVEG